jgi:toxin ParE1/3/4
MYNLTFSKIFKIDANTVHRYIKETLEAPMAAENLKKELLEKLDCIKEKPYSRPLVQDKFLASFGIRSIKVKNYLLFYNIEEEANNINAITFMYNKRDWANIIKEMPLDEIM